MSEFKMKTERRINKPKGNPWLKIKCEECNQQILSYKLLGLASFFRKDDKDPWKTGMSKSPIRYICEQCSDKLGYEDIY